MIEGLRRYFAKHGESDGDGDGGAGEMSDGDGSSDNEGGTLTVKELLKQPGTARAAFVCVKDANGYYKPGCLSGSCAVCGGFKLIGSRLEGTGLLPSEALPSLVKGGDANEGGGIGNGMDNPEAGGGGAGGGDPIGDDEGDEDENAAAAGDALKFGG